MRNAFAIFAVLASALVLHAQVESPAPAVTAPVTSALIPPKLTHAHSVYIANAGSDSGLFPHPFSGDPDRAYKQFYSDVQSMDRFTVVNDPGLADLVLELHLIAVGPPQQPFGPEPMFRLVVYDTQTHYILWAASASVVPAGTQKTHDKNFDEALASLTEVLKRVCTPPVTP
jgi:hypothetical protein